MLPLLWGLYQRNTQYIFIYAVLTAWSPSEAEFSLVLIALIQAMDVFVLLEFLFLKPDKEISLCRKCVSCGTEK